MTKNELSQHAIALQQRIDNLEANSYVFINEIETIYTQDGEVYMQHAGGAFLVISAETLFPWLPSLVSLVVDENKKETARVISNTIDSLKEYTKCDK
tara:strand:+ start:56 stop:346 length:291 start_codon:yes stop_codon:yes gene_type:complete